MHHFDPWMAILNFLLVKGLNAAWDYGKQLVQAAALYWVSGARLLVSGWPYKRVGTAG